MQLQKIQMSFTVTSFDELNKSRVVLIKLFLIKNRNLHVTMIGGFQPFFGDLFSWHE